MKKIISFFLLFIFQSFNIFSQNIPNVPFNVQFADVNIQLNTESRQQISTEVQRLLTPQNNYLDKKLERMQLYFPIIEKIFIEENVPDDLKYLALVESGLNADAVSPTKAVGFWQFKDFTAEEMGLTINRNQDDRKNIQLSTKAAAKYLKKNNLIFKNWVSTVLSYTLGAGGAASLVPVEWSFANEIKLTNTLHPYLISAIANKIAFSDRLKQMPASDYSFIEFPAKGKSFAQIASDLNISEYDVSGVNSWFTGDIIPTDKDYIVLIKTDRASSKILSSKTKEATEKNYQAIGYPQLTRLTTVVTSTDQPVFYEINGKKGILAQPGDEIPQIAGKAKMKISKFLKINDLTDRDHAIEGLVYYLGKKSRKADVPFHTLGETQTLWDVSHDYGVRLKNLMKFNRIKQAEPVSAGRILWLNKKRPRKEPVKYNNSLVAPPELFDNTPKPKEIEDSYTQSEPVKPSNQEGLTTHTVQQGETLFSLAKKYNTSVEELRRLNNLGQNDSINLFQTLTVPVVKATEINPAPENPTPKSQEKPAEVVIVPTTPTTGTGRHYVEPGETLFSLAKRYNTSVDELRRLNNMNEDDVLKSGEWLLVKGDAKQTVVTETKYHIVKRGETLFSISKMYNMTMTELKRLNNMTEDKVLLGQKMLVSASSYQPKSAPASSAPVYYTVKKGDTLFSIANRNNVSVEQIKVWNNLTSNNIPVGRKLIVKK